MKIIKRLAAVLLCVTGLFVFMVAPRMSGRPDTSALTGWNYAHRGYFDNENGIPENSLGAFENAIRNGYGIELDVQLSSDGVAMVFHDSDMERLCDVKGKVWDYSSSELKRMKLLDSGYTVPTLEEALELIDGQVPVIVEYKMDRVDTTVCEKGNELLADYKGAYCIKSYDPRVLLWYRKNAPQVVRGQLAEEFWESEKFDGKPLYLALTYMVQNFGTRPDFISYRFTDSDNISLNLCRLLGADTACWTLKTPRDYNSVKGSFDMYIFEGFDIASEQ